MPPLPAATSLAQAMLRALILFAVVAGGCAPVTATPAAPLRLELSTDPSPPRAGQAATLRAQLTEEGGAPARERAP